MPNNGGAGQSLQSRRAAVRIERMNGANPTVRLGLWGLKSRAIALCLLLLLATAGTLGTALIWHNYLDSLARLREHAAAYARAISHVAEPAVLLGDRTGLQQIARTATRYQLVTDACIFDATGNPLAQFHVDTDRPVGAPGVIPAERLAKWQPEDTRLEMRAGNLVVTAPIWMDSTRIELELLDDPTRPTELPARPVGFVQLTYCLDDVHAELRSRIIAGMAVIGVVVVGGLVVTLVATRQLLTPLKDLVQTSTAIAEGDREKRACEKAVGEIGVLARAFNHMADRLQASYASIEQQVTERTAELQKRQDELEREVVERKRTQNELRRAMESAESANRAKSEFLANMSHEIRTPMTAIVGFADVLHEEIRQICGPRGRTTVREAIETIRRNGDHLLAIINDILDLSKIEVGRMQVETVDTPLEELVRSVRDLMQVRADAKGLSLSVEYHGPVPRAIRTDPTRLRQILINLLANAIKFTEMGGVRLVVHFSGEPDGSGRICFDIVDSGIGMTTEQVAQIFHPFVQADTSTTRRFGGTGLGLTISKRLAELLGGDITVVATGPGRGTHMRVAASAGKHAELTMIEEVVTPAPAAGAPAVETPDAAGPLRGRILLVEDGPDNQRLITHLLRKAGAEVFIAENGEVALARVAEATAGGTPYDAIVMDMQMPVMDGYEATRALRQRGYDGPIIALTAHAMVGDAELCLQAGCNEYASKPINRADLIAVVRNHLASRRTGTTARA